MGAHDFSQSPIPILVVCNANVCRSPASEFALAQSDELEVQSAGLVASDGMQICSEAAEYIRTQPGGSSYVDQFASRPLNSIDWAKFELILTATVSIRSDMLHERSDLRNRMFTLAEARELTAEALSVEEQFLFNEAGPGPVITQRRGSQPIMSTKPTKFHKNDISPLDIVDFHGARSRRRHRGAIEKSVSAGSDISCALTRWRTAVG
ncbi:hypothetical protein [Arthrobacter sp.]|uniref:arsenate reductase/protein-tyrosine-phosphatase family protein n=1 Tax=Arthrobacter sp. TaxID=1667 RepID=UPI003A8E58B3